MGRGPGRSFAVKSKPTAALPNTRLDLEPRVLFAPTPA